VQVSVGAVGMTAAQPVVTAILVSFAAHKAEFQRRWPHWFLCPSDRHLVLVK